MPEDALMEQTLHPRKRIGLVAHDHMKPDLVEWALYNQRLLTGHDLVATGTTGTLLEDELGVGIVKLQSGPATTPARCPTTQATSTGS